MGHLPLRPALEYASTVWDPHQIYLQNKLERVQRRAARFVTNNYHNYEVGSMTKILEDLKLTPLRSRRKQNKVILLFKGLHAGTRIPLHDLKPPNRRTKNMNNQHFLQMHTRTNIFKFSFFPETIKLWNKIPNSILDISNLEIETEPVVKFIKAVREIDF